MSARQLQNLINEKNMNAQIGEIFRKCYYYDTYHHVSGQTAILLSIVRLAKAEMKRIKTVQLVDDL